MHGTDSFAALDGKDDFRPLALAEPWLSFVCPKGSIGAATSLFYGFTGLQADPSLS
jgi:hypothetical protein